MICGLAIGRKRSDEVLVDRKGTIPAWQIREDSQLVAFAEFLSIPL